MPHLSYRYIYYSYIYHTYRSLYIIPHLFIGLPYHMLCFIYYHQVSLMCPSDEREEIANPFAEEEEEEEEGDAEA